MLNVFIFVLLFFWLIGVWTGHTGWGTIHGLLLIIVPVFAMQIHSWWLGRKMKKRSHPQAWPPVKLPERLPYDNVHKEDF